MKMKGNLLCLRAEKELDFGVLKKTFQRIVQVYVTYLQAITDRITKRTTKDVERERRKFFAVKKDFFKFLVQHKKFYKLKTIDFTLNDGTVLYTMNINYSESLEHFIKIDDLNKLNEKLKAHNGNIKRFIEHYLIEDEILERLETVLGKSGNTNCNNMKLFLENHYLVDNDGFENNCSNYEELNAYIRIRFLSYLKSQVSIEHINKMSFKYQRLIKYFEVEKSCGICLDDYEKEQEACRLPCNHFCCRNCTEQMFAIPEDDSKVHFQCPICCDDCAL